MTTVADAPRVPHARLLRPRTGLTIIGLAALVLLYTQLERIAELVTYNLAGLTRGSHLAIDGKIVISGRVPKADEVRQLLGVA